MTKEKEGEPSIEDPKNFSSRFLRRKFDQLAQAAGISPQDRSQFVEEALNESDRWATKTKLQIVKSNQKED